jgi:hypothetical protein
MRTVDLFNQWNLFLLCVYCEFACAWNWPVRVRSLRDCSASEESYRTDGQTTSFAKVQPLWKSLGNFLNGVKFHLQFSFTLSNWNWTNWSYREYAYKQQSFVISHTITTTSDQNDNIGSCVCVFSVWVCVKGQLRRGFDSLHQRPFFAGACFNHIHFAWNFGIIFDGIIQLENNASAQPQLVNALHHV